VLYLEFTQLCDITSMIITVIFKLYSVQIYSPIILNRIADKSNDARYDYLSAIMVRIVAL